MNFQDIKSKVSNHLNKPVTDNFVKILVNLKKNNDVEKFSASCKALGKFQPEFLYELYNDIEGDIKPVTIVTRNKPKPATNNKKSLPKLDFSDDEELPVLKKTKKDIKFKTLDAKKVELMKKEQDEIPMIPKRSSKKLNFVKKNLQSNLEDVTRETDWYQSEYSNSHNMDEDYDMAATENVVEKQKQYEREMLKNSNMNTQYSGADDMEGPSVKVVVSQLMPPFLDGQTIYTTQKLAINPIRNPDSDLAINCQRGSRLVAERRFNKERKEKDSAALVGSVLGNILGVQETKEEKEAELETGIDSKKTIAEQRKFLPAYAVKDELLQVIRDNQVTIVIGETGSGKTTQLTQFLYEDGYTGLIGCTQPRRMAAESVAIRVAEEMGVQVGTKVGYSIRFEDHTSEETVIKYMTDGILLREALLDSNLDKYSVIIMDEAHERSLNTDVLMGMFKQILRSRRDLKLIITSATMNADRFSRYYGDAPQFTIPGRTYPVDIIFTKSPVVDYVESAVKQALTCHLSMPAGDILIFMTGQEDIETTCEVLKEKLAELINPPQAEILPIYSSMPVELQNRIFLKFPHRKIIVATNIAETSLTVDGVKYVIDSGYSKLKVFNAKVGMDSLTIMPISVANANQRSGRAGRTGPGMSFRLYTESATKTDMYQQTIPEIQRTNLSNTLLLLKSFGIKQIEKFPFLDPPPQDTMVSSLYELWTLGAIDNFGDLTVVGRQMSSFPLSPPLSKVLLTSVLMNCSKEMLCIVSMLSVPSVFYRPKERQKESDSARARFAIAESDHLTLLNVYQQWAAQKYNKFWCTKNFLHHKSLMRAREIYEQLHSIMEKQRLPITSSGSDWNIIKKCLCFGYFSQSAQLKNLGEYASIRTGMPLSLHPTSSLFGMGDLPPFVFYHELLLTGKEYINVVSSCDPMWLLECGWSLFSVRRPTAAINRALEYKKLKETQISQDLITYQSTEQITTTTKTATANNIKVGLFKSRRTGF